MASATSLFPRWDCVTWSLPAALWHYSWPWVAAGIYHTAGFCWTAIKIFPASSEQPPGRPKLNKGLLELLGVAACPA